MKGMPLVAGTLAVLLLSGWTGATAADWPQWRGPNRDGVVPDSPPLAESLGEDMPRKLWESEAIPGAGRRVPTSRQRAQSWAKIAYFACRLKAPGLRNIPFSPLLQSLNSLLPPELEFDHTVPFRIQ